MKIQTIRNNDYISAYTKDNKIVEGVVTSLKGKKVVLTESGKWYSLSSLKLTKIVEEDNKIADIIKGDVDSLSDDKLKNVDEHKLEDVAKKRAKELNVKEDEYVNSFVTAAKAKAAAKDIAAGNTTESEALKDFQESVYPELVGNFDEENKYEDTTDFDDFNIDEYIVNPKEVTCEEVPTTIKIEDVCPYDIDFANIYKSVNECPCDEECGEECDDICEVNDVCECHDNKIDIMSVIEKIIDEYTGDTHSFEPRDCYCLICKKLSRPQCIEYFDESQDFSKAIMKLTESL